MVSSLLNTHFYELVNGPPATICVSPNAGLTLYHAGGYRFNPYVAIDGESFVISKDRESIQIFTGIGDTLQNTTFLISEYHTLGGVSISGDTAVAGIPSINERDGSVSVFRLESGRWNKSQELRPAVITRERENFGKAVSIHRDRIAVGAYDYQDKIGSVYIFHRVNGTATFVQEANLLPNDPNLRGFGRSISIFGNTVVVGDREYEGTSGSVFVYSYEPSSQYWIQMNETITNDDCDIEFGSSLALTSDGGLLIGCPGEESGTGALYYYIRDTDGDHFILQQKITSLNGQSNEKFGGLDQIAVDGNIMVVGTERQSEGSVHIYAKMYNSWVEVNKIESPSNENDLFGYRVALSGRRVLVASINNVYSYSLVDEC